MSDALNYRQYAADCMRQAHQETVPGDRNVILNIALAWLRLADQAEAMTGDMMTAAIAEPAAQYPQLDAGGGAA